MSQRQVVPAATPWGATVGYSRAIRAGNHIFVAGTTSVAEDGSVLHPGDPYLQAKRCFDIIIAALNKAGAEAANVVRTRIYVTERSHWQLVTRAHAEAMADARPALTLVVVAGLLDPDMLGEIEAEAGV